MLGQRSQFRRSWWVGLLALCPLVAVGQTAVFQRLDPPDGSFDRTEPLAVSGNGQIVVGRGYKIPRSTGFPSDLGYRAVRWNANGVPTELPSIGVDTNGYTQIEARFVNPAGTFAGGVGRLDGGANRALVRWQGTTASRATDQILITMAGISETGVIAGRERNSQGIAVPIRWAVDGTTVELQPFPETTFANSFEVFGIARNGSVLVGSGPRGQTGVRAARWTAGGVISELPALGTASDGTTTAQAKAVSANGSVIVGTARKYDAGVFKGVRAVRWIQNTPQELAVLGTDASGSNECDVLAVSLDGQTTVGFCRKYVGNADQGRHIVRWNADGSVQEIAPLAPSGFFTNEVRAVSGDGQVIVGVRANRAVVWIGTREYDLFDVLKTDYGLTLANWSGLTEATGASDDGSVLAGFGQYQGLQTGFRVSLDLGVLNQPPVLAGGVAEGSTTSLVLGQRFVTEFTANDPDGNGVVLSATGLPPGATLTPAGGGVANGTTIRFAWSPVVEDQGRTYTTTLVATDNRGATARRTFALRVLRGVTTETGHFASTRGVVPFLDYYVPEGYVWSANAYLLHPDNAYLLYSYYYSIYAYYYHVYASGVYWTNPNEYETQLWNYKTFRYYQGAYSYYAFAYTYFASAFDYDDYVAYAYAFNYYNYVYGFYDFELP